MLCDVWDLPRPGIEPVSLALAGGFSTTVPPGKPNPMLVLKINSVVGFVPNNLCLVLLGYLGGFLHFEALIGWPLGNLF